MNVFDIIGPVMVGPSSSHTAGAVRMGNVARRLLGDTPVAGTIILHGSFATTGKGHGTDRAIVAGILGLDPADTRIPESYELAKEVGFTFDMLSHTIKGAHPNTAQISLTGAKGRSIDVQVSSIGGGRILVNKLDGITVNVTGENPTLIVHNLDQPGHVGEVTSMLAHKSVNIATMQLYRERRGDYAVMVIETDQPIPKDGLNWLERMEGVIKVTYFSGLEV